MSDRSHIDGIDQATAITNQYAAEYRAMFAVVLGLVPFKYGDGWCVLWGDDMESGISALGKTPYLAMANFDVAMRSEKGAAQ